MVTISSNPTKPSAVGVFIRMVGNYFSVKHAVDAVNAEFLLLGTLWRTHRLPTASTTTHSNPYKVLNSDAWWFVYILMVG